VAVVTGVSLLAHAPFVYRRLHAARREIALVAVSLLATVVALEVALRLFDPFGMSYFRESSRYHLDKIADPVLVYRHAPNQDRIYQGVRVSTNAMGLRERPLVVREPDELRILLLGDSVTFGWGVPVDVTFGRRLEADLGARLRRPVRTVNAGVGSYNTVQEHAFLKGHVDAIDPDVALLLYVSNDIEPNDPPFDPWSEVSLVGKAPPTVAMLLAQRSWLYRLGHFITVRSRARRTAGLDRSARGLRDSMAALADIARLCHARGIDFVVFFYRSKGQSGLDALLAEVQAVGERHEFPVIDVAPWWEQETRPIRNSTIDGHPNARGHEILARGMAATLVERALTRAQH
jgi:lysophospholipase L1-like esterase